MKVDYELTRSDIKIVFLFFFSIYYVVVLSGVSTLCNFDSTYIHFYFYFVSKYVLRIKKSPKDFKLKLGWFPTKEEMY